MPCERCRTALAPTNFFRGIWRPPKIEGTCTRVGNWSANSHADLNYLDGHHRSYCVGSLLLQSILTHDKNISRLVLQSPDPKANNPIKSLQFKRLLKNVLSKYKCKAGEVGLSHSKYKANVLPLPTHKQEKMSNIKWETISISPHEPIIMVGQ
jgi:hypothetical protein